MADRLEHQRSEVTSGVGRQGHLLTNPGSTGEYRCMTGQLADASRVTPLQIANNRFSVQPGTGDQAGLVNYTINGRNPPGQTTITADQGGNIKNISYKDQLGINRTYSLADIPKFKVNKDGTQVPYDGQNLPSGHEPWFKRMDAPDGKGVTRLVTPDGTEIRLNGGRVKSFVAVNEFAYYADYKPGSDCP